MQTAILDPSVKGFDPPAAINRMHAELVKRRAELDMWDDAYDGELTFKYVSDEFAKHVDERYADFSDNWCGVVANSPSERERPIGFRLDSTADMSAQEQLLWGEWDRNDGEQQASQGILQANISRRSYVLVWGSDDGKTTRSQIDWEHPSQMIVSYRPGTREGMLALKVWADDTTEYATLYAPDLVWKFQRALTKTASGLHIVTAMGNSGGWAPRESMSEAWPLPNPMGMLPVTEVANRPRLGREPVSEVAAALSMQRAINLLWAYTFNAADFASLPQRVVMGQEPPKRPIVDAEGNIVGSEPIPMEKLDKARLMWLSGEGATIGSWDAATLNAYTEVIEVLVGHLAAQTRTPPHYLIGKMANLSGDALVAAETGLVTKVREAQSFFGAALRRVFVCTATAIGDESLAEAARGGQVMWADPQFRSEAQLADALLKYSTIGYPFEYLLELHGKGSTEISRIMDMKRAGDVAEQPRDPAAHARDIAEITQKLYLGVGVLLSPEEGRDILRAAGAPITAGGAMHAGLSLPQGQDTQPATGATNA